MSREIAHGSKEISNLFVFAKVILSDSQYKDLLEYVSVNGSSEDGVSMPLLGTGYVSP